MLTLIQCFVRTLLRVFESWNFIFSSKTLFCFVITEGVI